MYLKHGRYYLVRGNKWIPLSRDFAEALSQYARRTAEASGIAKIVHRAINRPDIKENTRQQYQKCADRIIEAFQEFEPHQVTPPDVRRFLDLYSDRPVMANRMRSVLKMAFTSAVERGESPSNPVNGVKRYIEKPRDRYLTDDEYRAIQAHANPRMRLIMEMAYLTGQRIGDILKLKQTDIKGETAYFRQEKTSNRVEITSPAIPETVRLVNELHKVRAITLFHNGHGKPYDYYAARDCFKRACNKAKVENAQFRDIRAKSATDADAQGLNATLLLGHSDRRTTKIYLRNKRTMRAVGPKSIRQN